MFGSSGSVVENVSKGTKLTINVAGIGVIT